LPDPGLWESRAGGRPRTPEPIIDANSLIIKDTWLSLCNFDNSPDADEGVRASTIRMRACEPSTISESGNRAFCTASVRGRGKPEAGHTASFSPVIAHNVRRSIARIEWNCGAPGIWVDLTCSRVAQIFPIARHLRYFQSTGCPNVRLILRTATFCGLYEYKESGRSTVPPSIVIIFAM
jgi:hypothetical protein